MQTITITVDGLPPAKSEAQSMLGPRHPHAPRVVKLLEAVRDTAERRHFGSVRLGMEVVLTLASDRPSDLTNYAGGIADVLEEKGHRMALDHLGALADVALYDNDRQLCELQLREEHGTRTGYRVTVTAL